MGSRHRQEVPDGRGGKPRMKFFRQFVREVFGDPIVESEPAFVDHHPDRQRDQALADRIDPVHAFRRPRAQYPSAAILLCRTSRNPCMQIRSASIRCRKFRIAREGIPSLSGEGAIVNTFSLPIAAP